MSKARPCSISVQLEPSPWPMNLPSPSSEETGGMHSWVAVSGTKLTGHVLLVVDPSNDNQRRMKDSCSTSALISPKSDLYLHIVGVEEVSRQSKQAKCVNSRIIFGTSVYLASSVATWDVGTYWFPFGIPLTVGKGGLLPSSTREAVVDAATQSSARVYYQLEISTRKELSISHPNSALFRCPLHIVGSLGESTLEQNNQWSVVVHPIVCPVSKKRRRQNRTVGIAAAVRERHVVPGQFLTVGLATTRSYAASSIQVSNITIQVLQRISWRLPRVHLQKSKKDKEKMIKLDQVLKEYVVVPGMCGDDIPFSPVCSDCIHHRQLLQEQLDRQQHVVQISIPSQDEVNLLLDSYTGHAWTIQHFVRIQWKLQEHRSKTAWSRQQTRQIHSKTIPTLHLPVHLCSNGVDRTREIQSGEEALAPKAATTCLVEHPKTDKQLEEDDDDTKMKDDIPSTAQILSTAEDESFDANEWKNLPLATTLPCPLGDDALPLACSPEATSVDAIAEKAHSISSPSRDFHESHHQIKDMFRSLPFRTVSDIVVPHHW